MITAVIVITLIGILCLFLGMVGIVAELLPIILGVIGAIICVKTICSTIDKFNNKQ